MTVFGFVKDGLSEIIPRIVLLFGATESGFKSDYQQLKLLVLFIETIFGLLTLIRQEAGLFLPSSLTSHGAIELSAMTEIKEGEPK